MESLQPVSPSWVRDAVFYQIFPERFANGDPHNDPPEVQPWGTPPTPHNYMGGDLQGIIDHLDHLEQLGVNALYLTPIFQASSNHKYNTYDYLRIDPRFGTLETFQRLVRELRSRNMRLILDGVFNHCGRGFFPFHDLLEHGQHSPYTRWFHVERFPINAYDLSQPANYRTWWDVRSLPKLNTDEPAVRRFLLEVARYWIEQGADGWRLDVPNEIADHDFWREFRQVVKGVNPEAYIVGEIWHDGSPWLGGDQFDAVMNYLFRDLCIDFFAREVIDAGAFGQGIERLTTLYHPEVTYSQLNLLGSHDTARYLTLASGDLARAMLAFTFQLTYPGAPCIYYGDEIGMLGDTDPGCRGCFPWEPSQWNQQLYLYTRQLIALRRQHSALRRGQFKTLLAQGRLYAYARWDAQDLLVIALNAGQASQTISLPLPTADANRPLQSLDGHSRYFPRNGQLENVHVPPRSALILRTAA